MNGVLVVDKPRGITSFDVVRDVRRALKVKKVGHTGTLDPMATGVLPICIGDGTKIAQFITEATKAYDATLKLGATTDTLDAEGKVLETRPVPTLTRELIEAAFAKFRGPILQTPPMYSAVKIGGKRLYELARAGEEVERAARPVTVFELLLRDFSADEIKLSVTCSKGFFVRTLAAELGEALGCGAHLCALRRTQSGPFALAQALPLAELVAGGPELATARLVGLNDSLKDLPALQVTEAEAGRVKHGGLVEVAGQLSGLHRVLEPSGALLSVAEVTRGRLVYRRVFLPE
ncbi:MAG: tRNA pseudouridine(55) synthase TruB [Archangium sp.]|nr:tRNA pseudouridine(55) synthase TruB [Archangium sp.]MDP3157601.1 tRNA pseudouridine(55) synthase TruB [Archangium sp.]MDP3572001.1 tRNA pseudouridine(55) synthase TruB [Archangium sp.]